MKVLQDTGAIVSAVTTRGLCADVLRTVLAEHELVVCNQVLDEVRTVLGTKFSVPESLIAEYIELIGQDATVAEPKKSSAVPLKDKEDAKILSAAMKANVEVLVTGDREMQEIKKIGRMRILSPRAFWELLSARPSQLTPRPRRRR